MKNLILAAAMFFFAQSANAMGLFMTHTTNPVTATGVPACKDLCCLRSGESSSLNVLWLFEFGDAGIDSAAKCGCVRQIIYVDQTITTFLMFFKKTDTKVYGF